MIARHIGIYLYRGIIKFDSPEEEKERIRAALEDIKGMFGHYPMDFYIEDDGIHRNSDKEYVGKLTVSVLGTDIEYFIDVVLSSDGCNMEGRDYEWFDYHRLSYDNLKEVLGMRLGNFNDMVKSRRYNIRKLLTVEENAQFCCEFYCAHLNLDDYGFDGDYYEGWEDKFESIKELRKQLRDVVADTIFRGYPDELDDGDDMDTRDEFWIREFGSADHEPTEQEFESVVDRIVDGQLERLREECSYGSKVAVTDMGSYDFVGYEIYLFKDNGLDYRFFPKGSIAIEIW